MRSRVLVIGSVGIDVICPTERLPMAGETLLGDGYSLLPGGKALVGAMTFAEMGIEPILCSAIGEDAEGERIRAFCKSMELDSRFLFSVREASTAMRMMMTDPVGNRYTVRYPGCVGCLREEQLEDAFTCLPDALYLQGDMPEELLQSAISYARQQQLPILFDAVHVPTAFDLSSIGPIEVFLLSEEDTKRLTGNDLFTQDDIMRACIRLASMVNAKYYVLKLGTRGCMMYDGTYCKFSAAYDVELVDSCGAGEIFSAILSAEYLRTGNIRRAMECANAGAALSVTKHGSIASIPHREQIMRVVHENSAVLT